MLDSHVDHKTMSLIRSVLGRARWNSINDCCRYRCWRGVVKAGGLDLHEAIYPLVDQPFAVTFRLVDP